MPELPDELGVPARAPGRPRRAPRSRPAAAPPGARSRPERTARTPAPPAAARATAPAPRAARRPPARPARRPGAAPVLDEPREALGVELVRRAPAGCTRPASSSSASASPSALRSRETYTCTVLTALAGASSPHSANASRSACTGSLGCNSNTARTARGLMPPNATGPDSLRASRGPRIRYSTGQTLLRARRAEHPCCRSATGCKRRAVDGPDAGPATSSRRRRPGRAKSNASGRAQCLPPSCSARSAPG